MILKILKWVGITILFVVVLLLIVALFIPKTFTVSVSQVINKPRQDVYDYVRMLENQTQYNIWVMADPHLNPQITGTDGTVGATQHWNSKDDNVGEGEQEITALSIDKMVVDLRFKRPFEGNAKAAYLFHETSPTQTELVSEFYSNSPYPFNLMGYVFGRKMIREAQEQNLANIKTILEKTN